MNARLVDREWWAIVPIPPISAPEEAAFRLEVEFEPAGSEEVHVCDIELRPEPTADLEAPEIPDARRNGDPIAICMATREPPLQLFERQVESIREQTHTNWLCVVSDDASSPESLDHIKRVLAGDERFLLFPGERRLGFYANFERALSLAPEGASYVALSDQDDRWHPEKLETLLASLADKDVLAYGDMRIVTPEGKVLSDTYWRHRRNNWTDLGTLLIGNTVTGATSIFRRSLLERALPFPPPVNGGYHDHWLAVVALASGDLRYVDRPLQDYVQHPGAVIGFSSANADRGFDGGPAALIRRAHRVGRRLVRPEARRRYFSDYCRIALLATAADLRCAEIMAPEKRSAIDWVLRLDESSAAVARLALRSLAPGNVTMGVDRSVLAGLAWSRGRRRGRESGSEPG